MKVIPSSPVAYFTPFVKLDGVVQNVEGEHHQLYRLRKQTSRPFYELIYQTIRPEILSSLVANERSGSLLSGDVPGYEIWT